MKRLQVLLVAVFALFVLAACGGSDKVLENTTKDYYVTGQFNGWGPTEGAQMEAIKLSDERIASIKGELKGVQSLYILEVTLPAEEVEWSEKYMVDGTLTEYNGNLSIKVIRTEKDDVDVMLWMPSPESGEIQNITPDTLVIPMYRDEAEVPAENDNLGHWNSNPVAKEAGNYYVVFAEKGAGREAVRFLGLIKKS